MKIAIIGSGFVGKAVAQAWKAQGHTVTLATRSEERVPELMSYGRVVVVSPGQFKELLKGQEIVLLSVASSNYEETYLGSARALIRDLDSSATQILYTSSSSVYGEQEGRTVDETTACQPSILLETEQILQNAPCKVCILRLGEIVGPGRRVADRLRKLTGPLPGTGDNFCNLSPLEEIVKALLMASQHGWQGIYNVCSDFHPTRRALYEQICKEEGLPPVTWDSNLKSAHGGNKIVSSKKFGGLC